MQKNIITGSLILFSLLAVTATAYAYAAPSGSNTQAPTLPSVQSAAQWNWAGIWQNVSGYVGTVTKGSVSVPTSLPVPQGVSGWATEQFNSFDAWLYGVAGFHISAFFIFILNILSWILGIAKSIVDGLLSWLH
jgi:hypothetical protein